MHRLVIALTTLLSLTAAAVVAGYLFLFAAQPDRAAEAVPDGTAFYATLYLQPSTGQKLNLAELMSRVPGFSDRDALDQKIHEITARFLRQGRRAEAQQQRGQHPPHSRTPCTLHSAAHSGSDSALAISRQSNAATA